ncbi:dihydrofolate reductase family protein [Nonomuraea sp. NBC_01738]|uniref:dihydrofolate reductase family protein n=1 Tax=Nonomuraea sp. NBC_01738 TaxID=2976003 RepID=UPI002E162535|nr:dihydrofolate reductase family protein [Nonomuraea sp. NBC_01738]
MRKLIESTFITLDGVVDGLETWSVDYFDEEYGKYANELLAGASALLLGRETFEGFAGYWPTAEESEGEYAVTINKLPKYVASRTLTEAGWNGTVIAGDVAGAVAKLKEEDGGHILKFGTGELDRALLGLVDEYHFWVHPVIAGSGQRVLDGVDTTHLEYVRSTPLPSGVIVQVYAPKQSN